VPPQPERSQRPTKHLPARPLHCTHDALLSTFVALDRCRVSSSCASARFRPTEGLNPSVAFGNGESAGDDLGEEGDDFGRGDVEVEEGCNGSVGGGVKDGEGVKGLEEADFSGLEERMEGESDL
jgi:hypothetical protein